jgi:hypothetical protein
MSETKASGSNYGVRSNNQKPSAGQASHIGNGGGASSKPDLAGGF